MGPPELEENGFLLCEPPSLWRCLPPRPAETVFSGPRATLWVAIASSFPSRYVDIVQIGHLCDDTFTSHF